MELSNPFTPTFGVTPPLLVGREVELSIIERALRNGPGDPARATLFTGARGTGKTVLLNALERLAVDRGWAVLSLTLREGTLAEVTDTLLPALLAKHDRAAEHSEIVSGSISVLGVGGGLTKQTTDPYPVKPSFRSQLERLAAVMGRQKAGVFISLDEIQRGAIGEMRELFQGVQHCFRQGLDVAVVAAGLPSSIQRLLNDSALTFLRRAERVRLGLLEDDFVRAAIRQPVINNGRAISADALDMAVSAVSGYPFLIQQVGFSLWEADPATREIDAAQAEAAVPGALSQAGRLVFEPILAELTPKELAFAHAMADQGEPAANKDIEARLGTSRGAVAQLRAKLVAAEVIEPAGRGTLRFTVPLLAEHLKSKQA